MRRQERTVADGVVGRILGGRLLGGRNSEDGRPLQMRPAAVLEASRRVGDGGPRILAPARPESPAVIVGGESKLDPDAYTCRNCGRKSTPSTETPRETDVVTAFSLATEASV